MLTMKILHASLFLVGTFFCAKTVLGDTIRYEEEIQINSFIKRGAGAITGNTLTQDNQKLQLRDESVDNYITMVLENFAVAMRTGIPILGIPVLDPYNITKLSLPEINTEAVQMDAEASDISVSGTSSYTPTYVHVDFEENKMYMDLHFLDVRVDGNYWCDGLLLLIFPVFGDGYFYIDAVSTSSSGTGGVYVTDDDHLQITELTLTLTYDKLDIYFDNFLGGGSFGEEVNEALNSLANVIVAQILPLLNTAILPELVSFLNGALMQHTISEIIDGLLPSPPAL